MHGITPWHIDFASYNRLAGFLYCGDYVRKADRTLEDSFYIMFNTHWELHDFELPMMEGMNWEIIFHTSNECMIGRTIGNHMVIEPRSIIVLKSVKEIKTKKEVFKAQEGVADDETIA